MRVINYLAQHIVTISTEFLSGKFVITGISTYKNLTYKMVQSDEKREFTDATFVRETKDEKESLTGDEIMEISAFYDARKQYHMLRKRQMNRICRALEERKFIHNEPNEKNNKLIGRADCSNYTSRSKFKPAFDLSYWNWILCRHEDHLDFLVYIRLQTMEQDSKTHNLHALLDRISFDIFYDPQDHSIWSEEANDYQENLRSRYHVNAEYDEACFKDQLTEFELPLTNAEIQQLIGVIMGKLEKLAKESNPSGQ